MRPLLKLFVAIVLLVCCAIRVPAQETAPVAVPLSNRALPFVRNPEWAQLTGNCSLEVAPTKAVIVGGVAVSALKPTEAAEQLDKQLALMRAFIEENHGQLILLERARTVKPPPGNNSNDTEPPFQVVQRLHAEFPADAPMDKILQRMIELGLDRFGENVLNNNGSRRETVVRYRVGDFEQKVREMQQRCTADAWKQWCTTPQAKGVCRSDDPPADVQLQSFSARSVETVLVPDNGANHWTFNYSRGQPVADSPELLGNVTLHLTATASLGYSFAREEKP
jgi:hypothetical protein